jgi:hypothetical protein
MLRSKVSKPNYGHLLVLDLTSLVFKLYHIIRKNATSANSITPIDGIREKKTEMKLVGKHKDQFAIENIKRQT